MQVKNVLEQEVKDAVDSIQHLFENNLVVSIEQQGRNLKVRLGVKDTHKKGTHISYSGRRTPYACWHVYGYFAETLIAINHNAIIATCQATYSKDAKSWIDFNCGSLINPIMASEMCTCGDQDKAQELKERYENSFKRWTT